MALKGGDPISDDTSLTPKELAQIFIRNWCVKTMKKARVREEAQRVDETVEASPGTGAPKLNSTIHGNQRFAVLISDFFSAFLDIFLIWQY
jgi:hypothetical protein